MRSQSRSRIARVAGPMLLLGLLTACDPAVTVHLVRSDSKPMACSDRSDMTYTVHLQYRDGDQYTGSFEVDTRINHPTIGMLPGGIEREVEWIQFQLYCGDCKTPILVTPRISLPNELVKKDDLNYYYYLDWDAAVRKPQ